MDHADVPVGAGGFRRDGLTGRHRGPEGPRRRPRAAPCPAAVHRRHRHRQEGFRAPSIGELYGTLSRFDATLVDPCNNAASTTPKCVADGVPPGYEQVNPQISVVTSDNRDLQPEKSRSFMAGAVWSPG
ncbi:TonB-dependent receptor domain-containing protein [Stenotrophomonas daejeonensis]|uniref:TonB-dependent receptor domain-containing protein n=1 Tax=Stenotrophomonas daejeonensis TaxID=659018 RepID=UPI000A6CD0EF|nr:TonB-dependent receptor [Stenotrophomonas daejeonensis]